MPIRAITALATTKDAYSAAVRTKISPPILSSGLMRSSIGRHQAPAPTFTANATPMPACAIAVPQAEPATPQPNPYTNTSSSTTLAVLAATTMTSGARRSPTPRR